MFWGKKQLATTLRYRISDFSADRIDGAAYRLSIGDEIYISPTAEAVDPSTKSIVRLKEREAFAIPPGQFAFLLTKECVEVKPKELALISIRARTKYRGLVNVSGFHVDPGFKGRLTFAVFNAGPVAVHLRQGQEIFLIWYTDLTGDGEAREHSGPFGIESDVLTGFSGKLYSLASLASSVDATEQRLGQRLDAVARELAVFRVVAAIAVTALVGLLIKEAFFV